MGGGSNAQKAHKDAPKRKYREALPDDCPPGDASPFSEQVVIRLVAANPATADDFKSNAAKGERPRPDRIPPCVWAACSVFIHPIRPETVTDLLSYPKLRGSIKALVLVNESAGLARIGETGHASFWMDEAFDPIAAIQKYEPFP